MKYFGFISVSEVSEVYEKYVKEQERLKNDPRFSVETKIKANAAFEFWTKILADKK